MLSNWEFDQELITCNKNYRFLEIIVIGYDYL